MRFWRFYLQKTRAPFLGVLAGGPMYDLFIDIHVLSYCLHVDLRTRRMIEEEIAFLKEINDKLDAIEKQFNQSP